MLLPESQVIMAKVIGKSLNPSAIDNDKLSFIIFSEHLDQFIPYFNDIQNSEKLILLVKVMSYESLKIKDWILTKSSFDFIEEIKLANFGGESLILKYAENRRASLIINSIVSSRDLDKRTEYEYSLPYFKIFDFLLENGAEGVLIIAQINNQSEYQTYLKRKYISNNLN